MASSVPQRGDVDRWSVEQVAAWFRQMEMTECCEVFLRKGIDGHSLLQLTEENLVLWGRDLSIRNCKQIMKLINQIQNQHLSGRQQFNNVIASRGQVSSESDDGWTSDEFDDVPEQDTPHDIGNSTGGVVEDDDDDDTALYMQPTPVVTSAPNYPPHKSLSKPPAPSLAAPSPQQKVFPSPLVSALANRFEKNAFVGGQGPGPRGHAPVEPPRRSAPSPLGGRGPAPVPAFGAKPDIGRRKPVPIPGHPQGPAAPQDSARPGPPIPRPGSPKDSSRRGAFPLPAQTMAPDPTPKRGPAQAIAAELAKRGQALPPPQTNSNHFEQTDGFRRGPPAVPASSGLPEKQGPLDIKKRPQMPPPGSTGLQGPVPTPLTKTTVSAPETQITPPIRSPARPPPRPAAVNTPNDSRSASPSIGVGRGNFGGSSEGGFLPVRKTSSGNNRFNPPLQPPPIAAEESGHEYEVVEAPPNQNMQSPPALPPRNQDARDPVARGSGVPHSLHQPPSSGHGPPPVRPQPQVPQPAPIRPQPTLPQQPATTRPQPSLPQPAPARSQPPVPQPAPARSQPPVPQPAPIRPQPTLPQPTLPQQPAPARVQPSLPQPPVPTQAPPLALAPPPVPRQFGGQLPTQPRLPASLPQGPKPNQPFVDNAPHDLAPVVPGSQPVPRAGERVPYGDGGSIELTPLYRSIYDRSYFHIISRNKSNEMLETAEDGVFIIRPSTRSSEPLTLCLRYKGRTYNINIRCRSDGLFALGYQKANEMTFSSVDDLVSTYTREPIKLRNGDRTMLTVPPPKFDHIYVKMPSPYNGGRK